MRLPGKARPQFSDWLKGLSDPIDEQSKKKAYGLYENSILDTVETGTIKGLQQIHAYLFEGLMEENSETLEELFTSSDNQ